MEPLMTNKTSGISLGDDDDFEPQATPPSWHRPPSIIPNLGPKRRRNTICIPKSKVQHVLLHDNKNQNNILSSKVSHLTSEFKRSSRLFELHKKSFLVRQSYKQVGLWEKGIDHVLLVPDLVVQLHCPGHSKNDALQSPAARRMAMLKEQANRPHERVITPNIYTSNFLSRLKSYNKTESVISEDNDLGDNVNEEALKEQDPVTNFKSALVKLVTNNREKGNNLSVHDNTMLKSQSPQLEFGSVMQENDLQSVSQTHIESVTGLNRQKSNPPMIDNTNRWARPITYGQKINLGKTMEHRSKTAPLQSKKSGLTKSFSTYNHHKNSFRREMTTTNGMQKPVFAVSCQDPRFQRLRSQLIPSEKPVDTFLQLSPDGGKVVEKYGSALYNERELKDLLDRYNGISFMSTRRIRSAQTKQDARVRANVLSAKDAFVDDGSLYSSLNHSSSSLALSESE